LLGERISDYTEDQMQEMMDRKNGFYQALLETITEDDMLPGARELISEIKRRGLKVAVGSASKNTQIVLEKLQITAEFDGIADGHSVIRAKPAPDIFVHAAGQVGLPVAHCAVVEDAESGVQAALTAGMVAIGVGPEERVGVRSSVSPDFRYDSTADIDLDEILA
jgi:beta-phosphoglucomutase